MSILTRSRPRIDLHPLVVFMRYLAAPVLTIFRARYTILCLALYPIAMNSSNAPIMSAADNPLGRPWPVTEADQTADRLVHRKMMAIWNDLEYQVTPFSRVLVISANQFDTWSLPEKGELQQIMRYVTIIAFISIIL